MTQLKRRLAILLSFIMVFTTVFVAAPMEAQAKTTTSYSFGEVASRGDLQSIKTYKGAKNFYAGDYATWFSNTFDERGIIIKQQYHGHLSLLSGVTYKSDNTKVASVDPKTGLVKLNKTGTATISITYKKQTLKFKLTVLDKTKFFKELTEKFPYSNFKNSADILDKSAANFLKKADEKTNIKKDKDRFDVLMAYNDYTNYSGGYTTSMTFDSETSTYKTNAYLYAPTAAHANAIRNKIGRDIDSINPFSTNAAKHFEATKITGKGKTITAKLKYAVTDEMLLGANAVFSWDSEITKSDTYTFPIVVKNTSNGRQYYAIATVTKGSKTMTIELKNHKLAKNKTYELLNKTKTGRYSSYLGNWLSWGKSTFKAK